MESKLNGNILEWLLSIITNIKEQCVLYMIIKKTNFFDYLEYLKCNKCNKINKKN